MKLMSVAFAMLLIANLLGCTHHTKEVVVERPGYYDDHHNWHDNHHDDHRDWDHDHH